MISSVRPYHDVKTESGEHTLKVTLPDEVCLCGNGRTADHTGAGQYD